MADTVEDILQTLFNAQPKKKPLELSQPLHATLNADKSVTFKGDVTLKNIANLLDEVEYDIQQSKDYISGHKKEIAEKEHKIDCLYNARSALKNMVIKLVTPEQKDS